MLIAALALLVLAFGALMLVIKGGGLARDLTGREIDDGGTGEWPLRRIDAR